MSNNHQSRGWSKAKYIIVFHRDLTENERKDRTGYSPLYCRDFVFCYSDDISGGLNTASKRKSPGTDIFVFKVVKAGKAEFVPNWKQLK
jgi:hypothetical protein